MGEETSPVILRAELIIDTVLSPVFRVTTDGGRVFEMDAVEVFASVAEDQLVDSSSSGA